MQKTHTWQSWSLRGPNGFGLRCNKPPNSAYPTAKTRLVYTGYIINHVVYHQGDVHQALIVLQKGVAQCFPEDEPLINTRSLQTKGKAMLLVGRFMEETANFESNAIMKVFKVNKMTPCAFFFFFRKEILFCFPYCCVVFLGCNQPSA